MRAVVRRRPAAWTAALLVVVAAVVGGAVVVQSRGTRAVRLADPGAPASTAAACRRFDELLPAELGDLQRRPTNVERVGVAAYGDPAVVVLCGAPLSGDFSPGDPLLAINGVAWFAEERPDVVVFSLPRSIINVEVRIPRKHPAELLSLLTDAVRQAQPL